MGAPSRIAPKVMQMNCFSYSTFCCKVLGINRATRELWEENTYNRPSGELKFWLVFISYRPCQPKLLPLMGPGIYSPNPSPFTSPSATNLHSTTPFACPSEPVLPPPFPAHWYLGGNGVFKSLSISNPERQKKDFE